MLTSLIPVCPAGKEVARSCQPGLWGRHAPAPPPGACGAWLWTAGTCLGPGALCARALYPLQVGCEIVHDLSLVRVAGRCCAAGASACLFMLWPSWMCSG